MAEMHERPLSAEEKAKIVAETEEIRSRMENERMKAEAEVRKLQVETLNTDTYAATQKIGLDREQEKRERELSALTHQRVYHFNSVVDPGNVVKCMNELAHWSRIDPGCNMEIVFNSPGGSVFAGMELFDYIQELRRKGHFVTTSARGYAASMAGILLQAGDKRIIGREGFLLIHEVSSFAMGKVGEIEDEMALLKKMSERVIDIFASRSKLSKAKIRNGWRRKDWWLDSDDCLKLGLVDEVR